MRILFLCSPSRAFGEINVIMPLAEDVVKNQGEVWFLASPLAARVARRKFPNRVFELGPNRLENQSTFWRMVKKYRANMIVFSELYEVLQPRRQTDCPLLDARFFTRLEDTDASMVFMDFIAHVPILREIGDCLTCSRPFGGNHLRSFFERLWVILPCPLNEPSEVEDRSGIPYRTESLPVPVNEEDRIRVRSHFLGPKRDQDILIVRTGSTWQAKLAVEYGVPLYDRLTELLAIYLRGIKKSVTLVTVSDQQQLSPDRSNRLRVVNLKNLPPADYERLILSADMVFTDNQIGYTLAKTIGNVPGVVFVNSYNASEILEREQYGSPLWRLVAELEQKCPGAIYPHQIFPLPTDADAVKASSRELDGHLHDAIFEPETIRLGRMVSSPYVRAELFGGKRTAHLLHWLLDDPSSKAYLRQYDQAYIERLKKTDNGAAVLSQLYHNDRSVGNTVW